MIISNDAINDNLTIFTCIPFSSVKVGTKIYPTEIFLSSSESDLPKDSILILQQIRTASQDLLCNKVRTISDEKIKEKINWGILKFFELD